MPLASGIQTFKMYTPEGVCVNVDKRQVGSLAKLGYSVTKPTPKPEPVAAKPTPKPTPKPTTKPKPKPTPKS